MKFSKLLKESSITNNNIHDMNTWTVAIINVICKNCQVSPTITVRNSPPSSATSLQIWLRNNKSSQIPRLGSYLNYEKEIEIIKLSEDGLIIIIIYHKTSTVFQNSIKILNILHHLLYYHKSIDSVRTKAKLLYSIFESC